ncbi:MAG: DUF2141 domain-containing protein [Nonlabens sp.]
MKFTYLTLLMTFLAFAKADSQNTLTLQLSDIEETKGILYFSLFNSSDGFPDDEKKDFRAQKILDFGNTISVTFKDIPDGTYAVTFFQDENNNGKVDTNFFGIPKEPVGASMMDGLGRPKFDKCKFEVKSDKTLKIEFMN